MQEIANPELPSACARERYQAKRYPQAWMERRLRSSAVPGVLTDESKERSVQEGDVVLTSLKNAPAGPIREPALSPATNHLNDEEMDALNRIVRMDPDHPGTVSAA